MQFVGRDSEEAHNAKRFDLTRICIWLYGNVSRCTQPKHNFITQAWDLVVIENIHQEVSFPDIACTPLICEEDSGTLHRFIRAVYILVNKRYAAKFWHEVNKGLNSD